MVLRDMCSRLSCKTKRMLTEHNLEAVHVTSDLTYCITMFEVNVGSPVYYVMFTHCHIW